MGRTLLIGFGNIYRRDDGVAFVVLNAVREELGCRPLTVDEDGYDELGQAVDTVFLHQLVPELADLLADYETVVFIDAHVGAVPDDVQEVEVEVCYRPGTVYHQLPPSSLLSVTQQLHGRCPRGVLISIKGVDFDFGDVLSPATSALVPAAVERILNLINEHEHAV